jgi:hypothetical protein
MPGPPLPLQIKLFWCIVTTNRTAAESWEMANEDFFFLTVVGGVFLVLGLFAMFWGRREEKQYFEKIATRTGDLREFMNAWPPRPQPGALKLGGWIAIAIGVLTAITGLAFFIWG